MEQCMKQHGHDARRNTEYFALEFILIGFNFFKVLVSVFSSKTNVCKLP